MGCGLLSGLLLPIVFTTSAHDSHARSNVRGVIGTDDRTHLTQHGAPWDAIGQVNISGYRTRDMCTGTLIAPDRVLTAAHCLIDTRTGAPHPPRRIHFVAGVRPGLHKGHAKAACVRFRGEDGAPDPGDRAAANIERDAAIIFLRRALLVTPARLAARGAGRRGAALVHVAYGSDRRFGLSAHIGCRLRRVSGKGVWRNDCDTTPASSGGPVFVRQAGELALAAIMVRAGNRGENIALQVSEWDDLTATTACGTSR